MLCTLDLANINYLKFKNFTGNLSGGEASSAHDLPLEIQKSEGLVDQTVSISLKNIRKKGYMPYHKCGTCGFVSNMKSLGCNRGLNLIDGNTRLIGRC